jgi:hypothetical protein
VQPPGIEPGSTVLQTAAMTTSAKVAYKIGRLTILLGGLTRLSRIVKFNTGFNHTVVSSQLAHCD